MSPDDSLNCLLVQPKFSANNFWNFVEVAKAIGARTYSPPLGLLTVAAMLPEQWTLKLVDLNVREIEADEWEAADLICVGGMLPQQSGILEIIARANESNKYVAVGGPDPTSQPELYSNGHALVLGEGEASIPIWLDSWREGKPNGVFQAAQLPDVTTSPVPRYDLINFGDYINVGLQISRGCPFNCEFCDIIELYGRVPRTKTAKQVLAELDNLYDSGFRGYVDLVDDNFIGNKRQVKPILRALHDWCKRRYYPFHFGTEATLNLADDEELLDLMRRSEFRTVFVGIETPDPELLAVTQKRVNAMKPIVERLDKIYKHGMVVTAGFILGFDSEKSGCDEVILSCIRDSNIVVPMVGLLCALPNTQLTRRLQSEGRLISWDRDLEVYTDTDQPYRVLTVGGHAEHKDNQAAGLNFITTRDRVEIYREYKRVIETIYDPKEYMDRVLGMIRTLKVPRRRVSPWWQLKREVRGLINTMIWMTRNKSVRRYYWRNTLCTLLMRPEKFETAQMMMSLYMHFAKQSQTVSQDLDGYIEFSTKEAIFPRMVDAAEAAESA